VGAGERGGGFVTSFTAKHRQGKKFINQPGASK
jgi:hypothetical protein